MIQMIICKICGYEIEVKDNVVTDLLTNNIEIDIIKLRRAIDRVEHDNYILSKISADLELHYEDFDDFLSPTKKTPLPANYSKVVELLSKLYSPGIRQY